MLATTQPQDAVLHDDHGAVDDQTKIERAEAHQIRRDPGTYHARDQHQHGEGNDGSGQKRRSDIAQQQQQYRHDQDRPFKEVVAHRGDGLVDQHRTVIDRFRSDTLWQRPGDLGEFGSHGRRDRSAVLADQHDRCAEYRFLAVMGCGAGSQLFTEPHVRYIAHRHRNPVPVGDNDLFDGCDIPDLARRADQILLTVALDIAGTDVSVVLLQCADQIIKGQTKCQ